MVINLGGVEWVKWVKDQLAFLGRSCCSLLSVLRVIIAFHFLKGVCWESSLPISFMCSMAEFLVCICVSLGLIIEFSIESSLSKFIVIIMRICQLDLAEDCIVVYLSTSTSILISVPVWHFLWGLCEPKYIKTNTNLRDQVVQRFFNIS